MIGTTGRRFGPCAACGKAFDAIAHAYIVVLEMGKMAALMQDPAAMQEWFDARRAEFEAQPVD